MKEKEKSEYKTLIDILGVILVVSLLVMIIVLIYGVWCGFSKYMIKTLFTSIILFITCLYLGPALVESEEETKDE